MRPQHRQGTSLKLKVEFEKLISSITYDNNVILTPDFKENLKSMEANGLCSSKQNQFLHKSLRALSLNKNIKICKYDKGNGVVVLNCTDYFDKLDTIILDIVRELIGPLMHPPEKLTSYA